MEVTVQSECTENRKSSGILSTPYVLHMELINMVVHTATAVHSTPYGVAYLNNACSGPTGLRPRQDINCHSESALILIASRSSIQSLPSSHPRSVLLLLVVTSNWCCTPYVNQRRLLERLLPCIPGVEQSHMPTINIVARDLAVDPDVLQTRLSGRLRGLSGRFLVQERLIIFRSSRNWRHHVKSFASRIMGQ